MPQEQEFQLQICWGPSITDSGWQDIASAFLFEEGIAEAMPYAGKLGQQFSEFQLDEDTKVTAIFNISQLPFNLAYNLPKKKIKVYTNWYWVRFKPIGESTWSEPSRSVAITYIK